MAEPEVPDGAAVFPLIPAELGIQPLLLAVLHAIVFLDGSDKKVVNPEAAAEAQDHIAAYLQRLIDRDLARVREDLEVLRTFAKQERWGKAEVQFLKEFLANFGVGMLNEGPRHG
jgi:hypothetical protein